MLLLLLLQLTAGFGQVRARVAVGSRRLTHFHASPLSSSTFCCAFSFSFRISISHFRFHFLFLAKQQQQPAKYFFCCSFLGYFFYAKYMRENRKFSPDHNTKRKCKCSSWRWSGVSRGSGERGLDSQKGKAKQCQWGVWVTCFRAKM